MKRKAGFTLLEATIALAVWAILSVSVIYVWHHVSARTQSVLARQSALENARVAMDALTINIQMAQTINLEVGPVFDLRVIHVDSFRFRFDYSLTHTSLRFQRMQFGDDANHIAHYIYNVQIRPANDDRQLNITITTACEYPIILEGTVDIRYKNFTFTRIANPNIPNW